MIRHDAAWLCPRRTRLYINYLGKVYGKNELDFNFWNPDHVTAMTSLLSSISQGSFFKRNTFIYYVIHPPRLLKKAEHAQG